MRHPRRPRRAVLLSDDQRAEPLNGGGGPADNRIGWALAYPAKAEAVSRPRRGEYLITDPGRTLLAQHAHGGLVQSTQDHAGPGLINSRRVSAIGESTAADAS
ncbi:MAG: restriction system protein [Pseudonocardiales bacterium]|nr:restriction system protein [Pseudonocardiales bacterium]